MHAALRLLPWPVPVFAATARRHRSTGALVLLCAAGALLGGGCRAKPWAAEASRGSDEVARLSPEARTQILAAFTAVAEDARGAGGSDSGRGAAPPIERGLRWPGGVIAAVHAAGAAPGVELIVVDHRVSADGRQIDLALRTVEDWPGRVVLRRPPGADEATAPPRRPGAAAPRHAGEARTRSRLVGPDDVEIEIEIGRFPGLPHAEARARRLENAIRIALTREAMRPRLVLDPGP